MSEKEVRELLKSAKKLNAQKEVLGCFGREDEKYSRVCRTLHIIENCLKLLTDEEHEIIQMHLMEGCTWEEVMAQYEQKHGQAQGYSERTYKRIQRNAVKKIAEVVGSVQIEEL